VALRSSDSGSAQRQFLPESELIVAFFAWAFDFSAKNFHTVHLELGEGEHSDLSFIGHFFFDSVHVNGGVFSIGAAAAIDAVLEHDEAVVEEELSKASVLFA
jgi:hypothetical protein